MKDLMKWEECTEKFVYAVSFDSGKFNSIVTSVQKRIGFLHTLKATEQNVSFIFEQYYEIIKELLLAFMLKKGMRSKNHQCLITFFARENPTYEQQINLISQMSFLRNRLEYYGESIDIEFYNKNKDDFNSIIKILEALIR